jgi:hypothetical protein
MMRPVVVSTISVSAHAIAITEGFRFAEELGDRQDETCRCGEEEKECCRSRFHRCHLRQNARFTAPLPEQERRAYHEGAFVSVTRR